MTDIISHQLPVESNLPVLAEPTPGQEENHQSWHDKLKQAAQAAIVVGEISPINEVARLGFFGAGETLTHSPVVGAITLGVSTLVIEGSAALAMANLSDSQGSKSINERVRGRLAKLGYDTDSQVSRTSIAASAFLGGSAVSMALRNLHGPAQTLEQNRNFGLRTAAWLAGTCAVLGAMGSETVDYALNNPATASIVAGSALAAAAGRKARHIISERRGHEEVGNSETPTVWLDYKKGIKYGRVGDTEQLRQADELEQRVWDEMDYGNLEEEGYDKYINSSRTFVAFKDGRCIGMNRMFGAHEGEEAIVPPFLDEEFSYYDEAERELLKKESLAGDVEELGTVAIDKEFRGKGVNLRLWRLAYRDARERGIKKWGIIMEPERVQRMNEHHGFTFRQISEPVWYQGGECAAHIMDLEEVDESMHSQHPLEHYWFAKKSIRP